MKLLCRKVIKIERYILRTGLLFRLLKCNSFHQLQIWKHFLSKYISWLAKMIGRKLKKKSTCRQCCSHGVINYHINPRTLSSKVSRSIAQCIPRCSYPYEETTKDSPCLLLEYLDTSFYVYRETLIYSYIFGSLILFRGTALPFI